MNEEQKNIETCLSENILSEVANVPTDPQFRSLVEESFDPLKQQALQQAGYDGYKEVVWTHQPYTFTSSVKQMKSNLILLLRRLWRYPFGRSTTASSEAAPIRSLADMWQHYIHRLKGNSEYSIPSRLSQLTDLPSAPALLADRDMSSGIRFGENPLPDGMSIAQLLCSSAASSVTEIVDTNVGWTMDKAFPIDTFANATKLTFECSSISAYQFKTEKELEIHYPHCQKIADINIIGASKNVSVWFESMETLNQRTGGGGITTFWVKDVYLPAVKKGVWRVGDNASHFNSITKYIYIGCKGSKTDLVMVHHNYLVNTSITDIEVSDGACQNITISNCNGLTPENMYNHILCRLKQDEPMCGYGVTITLGTTNIEKLEAVEEYNTKLTELENTYGYTFA